MYILLSKSDATFAKLWFDVIQKNIPLSNVCPSLFSRNPLMQLKAYSKILHTIFLKTYSHC